MNDQDNQVHIPFNLGFTPLEQEFNENYAGWRSTRYLEDTENFETHYVKRTLVFSTH